MTNNYWRNIYNSYRKIFDVYTESEDQKYQYTKETILKIINTVDTLYSKGWEFGKNEDNDKILDFLRTNPQAIDAQLKELQDKVVKSVDNFQVLTEGNLNEALTTQPLETFAPYEAKKKIEEVIIV